MLLSARIRASVAVVAARELSAAGLKDPKRMADADGQERCRRRGGYRRCDERTATLPRSPSGTGGTPIRSGFAPLGHGADLLTLRWHGDLRRLHAEAAGDVSELRRLLQEVSGLGPAGADIFPREAQRVWSDLAPYLDGKAHSGADRLLKPAGDTEPAVPAAALVRAALDKEVVEESRHRAA